MRILLIYPTSTTNGRPNKYRKAYIPPLNLAILDRLTHLASRKHTVKIINDCVEEIDFNAECDLVGITSLTSQAVRAYQIADKFRALKKKVVMGGVHPSLMPEESLKHSDAVVVGEAEQIWAEILSDCENKCLKRIYKDSTFPDLSELIIPKWNNANLSIYRRSFGRKMPRMPIYTTRGCVNACSFCSVSKFFGRSYRCKPIEHVIKEINSIKAESYFFTDDNIVCKPDYSRSLFKALARINDKFRWFSQASTTILNTPDLIDQAAKAGCRSMFFGAESINPMINQSVKKKFNKPEKFIELADRCSRAGIQPWFSFIFGFDGDNLETMIQTASYLKKNNMWNVVFWILTPLPGTDLWDDMLVSNRIVDFDWAKYDLNHVVYKPALTSIKELKNNFWKIYKSMYTISSVYHRSRYAFEISRLHGMVNSILNQFYSFQQIRNQRHPYNMGIWKIN